jgi:predicted XRE-type DNA-binding protein
MPRAVAQNMPARLAAAAAAVTDTGKAHRLALKHRRELIFEAVDTEGMHQREVARLAGVAQSRVSAILARPDEDEDQET